MGWLDNRAAWERVLPPAVVTALEGWLADTLYRLQLDDWFTEGRSDDPVARVLRVSDDDADQLVLKFFTEDGADKIRQVRRAWNESRDFADHLAEPRDEVLDLGKWRGLFQHVAGSDLSTVISLSKLRTRPGFVDCCATIIRSIVTAWNEGKTPVENRKVADVLTDLMGRRKAAAFSWAQENGIDIGGSAARVSQRGWPEVPVNPFTLLNGEAGDRMVDSLIIGKAHGDLNGRNILVPTEPDVAAASYVLIDYDRFDSKAPLARDPMHLLVALTLDDFSRVGEGSRVDLATALVNPHLENQHVEPFRRLSAEIRKAAAPRPEKGLADKWTQQCLLALVGAGLVHLGRTLYTDTPAIAKQWCFHLAALAAQSYLEKCPPQNLAATAAAHTAGIARVRPRLVNRDRERHGLRNRLTGDQGGVVVLRGTRGVGKTALLDAVIAELKDENGSAVARFHRYDVNAVAQLTARTLIDFVAGEAGSSPPPQNGASSLVRLETALRRLDGSRVVITVDSAETMLDPATRQLVDPDLDEVLEVLATEDEHRVTVLLATQEEPVSPAEGTWPTADPVIVPKLDPDDFFEYFANLERNGILGLARLPDDLRQVLYRKLQGNPRQAELVYALVGVADSGLNLNSLINNLRGQETKDVLGYLTRELVEGMTPLRRRVMEALAAFDIPVPRMTVAGLLTDVSEEKVAQALEVLVSHRAIYLTQDGYYFLPRKDGKLVLSQMPDENARVRQYIAAATQLTFIQNEDPRSVADLSVHFAELRALWRAERYPAAYDMIRALDRSFLRKWNCSHLLLEHREEVRGKLADEHQEMLNENALGGIYVSTGRLPEADEAYGKALSIAGSRKDHGRLMRIHGNLAALYWEFNDTTRALMYFELARDGAEQEHDLVLLLGSLEGIADCYRRRGDYDAAIRHAQSALALPAPPDSSDTDDFTTTRRITITLKLARWYRELGQIHDAATHLDNARVATATSDDDWIHISYQDGLADMLFDRGDLEQAESAAESAIDSALLLNDRVTLLQARTTLCIIYLKLGRFTDARRAIKGAFRYRRRGRSLIVLALLALTTRQTGDLLAADEQFRRLLEEADERIALDHDDFAAWDYRGYALCGLRLEKRTDVDQAISAFEAARTCTPPTPVLVRRLRFMLEQLDRTGRRQERLGPVIDILAGYC